MTKETTETKPDSKTNAPSEDSSTETPSQKEASGDDEQVSNKELMNQINTLKKNDKNFSSK
ncbi:hypothetical protein [Halorubrum ezzemoulense]|uniref:hypothetical protein n=1 Tax=Halorubrum ezzemoulense TaxID=337243 RepID=UPI00113FDB92|nr:hypothetical protein [Halorubrum ezzemoulense]